MNHVRRRMCAWTLLLLVAGPGWSGVAAADGKNDRSWSLGTAAARAQQGVPQQQDEFVPLEELPPQDQLPAAPLLVAAYSIVVLALFGYVISVARRLNVVQRELARLESDLKRSGRA